MKNFQILVIVLIAVIATSYAPNKSTGLYLMEKPQVSSCGAEYTIYNSYDIPVSAIDISAGGTTTTIYNPTFPYYIPSGPLQNVQFVFYFSGGYSTGALKVYEASNLIACEPFDTSSMYPIGFFAICSNYTIVIASGGSCN